MLEHTWWIANNKEHVLSLAPVFSNNQGCLTAWGDGAHNPDLPAPKVSLPWTPNHCMVFAVCVQNEVTQGVHHVSVCQEAAPFYSDGLVASGTRVRTQLLGTGI